MTTQSRRTHPAVEPHVVMLRKLNSLARQENGAAAVAEL
jgi:hypothetical protein